MFELFDSIAIEATRLSEPYMPVEIFNLSRFIPMTKSKDILECPKLMWRDGDHWSHYGEVYFVQQLVEASAFNF